MNSEQRRNRLEQLVGEYTKFKKAGRLDLTSEETIRTWLNQLLEIFGWDVRDTSQVLQEKVLSAAEKARIQEIGSTNIRPDYTFKVAKEKLTFLDAKDITVNIEIDSDAAFQIKSYGWSIVAPCAFLSNFEQFAIYDCTYIPSDEQPADFGRIFFTINDYVENFEILERHLLKENVYNGELNRIYSETTVTGVSKKTTDLAFAEIITAFRLILATDILNRNAGQIQDNEENLSFVVQVLINRVLFIRICEVRKIEEEGLLLSFQKQGFWEAFKQSSYLEFFDHYDGHLFDRITSIHTLSISDEVFDILLEHLYYPSPYRFDVIPTKLLSDIYEIFLSKKIRIVEGEVKDELKSEYSKTKGAVSTPQYIVEDIIRRTIRKKDLLVSDIPNLLNTKILDIACGSGVFAIMAFDYLADILKSLYNRDKDEQFQHLFVNTSNDLILSLIGKQTILENCIFGVDIDPEAVEVAKMSLALKIVDSSDYPQYYTEIGLYGSRILNGVGNNIKCGNSLVDSRIMEYYPAILDDGEQLLKTNIFDWASEDGFPLVFGAKGGFDYIIGNPPYVEVKHYNTELPFMHQLIKMKFEASKNGKIDLAVPFIERGIALLNDSGRLGFIIQHRWFKTVYGKAIRKVITDNNLLSSIVEFSTTEIFKGRMTYVSIMVLDKTSPDNLFYKLYEEPIEKLASELRSSPIPEVDHSRYYTFPSSSLSPNPWSFDDPMLLDIKTRLTALGILGDIAKIKVGVQALKNEAYHVRVTNIQNGIITGRTNWNQNFRIEENACRPLMCNEHFYMFRPDTTQIYVIFPYDVTEEGERQIPFPEYQDRFPLAGAYLTSLKDRLEGNPENGGVETLPIKYPDRYNEDYWHIYTRANNIGHTYPKILVPMTALDTFATVTFSDRLYCDNANMFFIKLNDNTKPNLYAVSGIINSTIFSVIARSIANPQDSGYYKFNKQFLEPIAFPVERYHRETELKEDIANLSRTIEKRQQAYITASSNQKRTIGLVLNRLWSQLDSKVYDLYDLSEEEINFFNERGRNLDRIDLLN